ncbi:MAG: AraC family transcriptional regulator, partial [Proteobacteria bacterium]|nr:AraC family transcriptional regulator [Pseudomonadota bacterium]
ETFKRIVINFSKEINCHYHTTVFASNDLTLPDIRENITSLYRLLENNTVIGLSRTIYHHKQTNSTADNRNIIDRTLSSRIEYLVDNGLIHDLKKEFIELFERWQKEEKPQIWIECMLRQILHRIETSSPPPIAGEHTDIDVFLDEAVFHSMSFGDLMASTWAFIEKMMRYPEKKNMKIDTPVFFKSIESYIQENLAKPLSLQSVCSVFGISQTYLSRLFRKYKNMSFNKYLTKMRLDEAKRLMQENSDITLKDIAAITGFSDQFYFSRVFRAFTGVPPSEYIAEMNIPKK